LQGFLARLFRRDNPFETTGFADFSFDEVGIAGEQGESGAKEIASVLHGDFGGLAAFEMFSDFIEARVAGAKLGDARVIGLNQSEQRRFLEIGWETSFQKGFGLMLFGGVKLGETRPKDVRLPEIRGGGDVDLLGAVIDKPDFGAVGLGGIADQDDFKDGLVWLEVDFVVKLSDERT